MNLLLFTESELVKNRVRLSGRRASHIHKTLRRQPGDMLRVGMINGRCGTGIITAMSENTVDLTVNLSGKPVPEQPLVTLILALPRPIMLQRILKQATVLGVRSFHLIRSQKVEKSFFHSPVLRSDKINSLLVEGLEQAMDTHLPDVHIHHRFKPFVEDVARGITGNRLLAHPKASEKLYDLAASQALRDQTVLAVGPEGGWSDYEVDCFMNQGFRSFSMGSRILHVDTAVVSLLAQVQLLYDLRNR